MNMKSRCAGLLATGGLVLASTAIAQEVKPEDRNAALKYATIAYSADRDLFMKAAEADVYNAGFDLAAAPQEFRQAVKAIEEDSTDTIKQLIQASKLKKCDFEPAWEEGVGLLLPHLGKFRANARLLRVDARRLSMKGDADGAAERLAAMIRMARQATNEHILISSLVGTAICVLAIDETQAQLDAKKLTPPARAVILKALESLDASDPFALKLALQGEQRWTLNWVETTFKGDDAGRKLVATGFLDSVVAAAPSPKPQAHPAPPGGPPAGTPAAAPVPVQPAPPPTPKRQIADARVSIALMNQQQLHAAVGLARPYYDQALAAWNDPQALEKLEALGHKVEQGDFGPLATFFAPSGYKTRTQSMKAEKMVVHMKQQLAAAN